MLNLMDVLFAAITVSVKMSLQNPGLILAQGCEIGELVTIEKDVTIWPNKVIEDAAIVSRSVILGKQI